VFWFLDGILPDDCRPEDDRTIERAGELYCASADWMDRNFFRRVEVAFPIEDRKLHERVAREALVFNLRDNTQSWMLERDGRYRRLTPDGAPAWFSQNQLIQELAEKT
jgi:polyphosphate kinase